MSIMTPVKQDELKEMLRMGKVHFEYKKADGTIREALGTLNSDYIPVAMIPKDSSTYKEYNLRYFDLDKNSWRSIAKETTQIIVL
jgi:hypothetical protein